MVSGDELLKRLFRAEQRKFASRIFRIIGEKVIYLTPQDAMQVYSVIQANYFKHRGYSPANAQRFRKFWEGHHPFVQVPREPILEGVGCFQGNDYY